MDCDTAARRGRVAGTASSIALVTEVERLATSYDAARAQGGLAMRRRVARAVLLVGLVLAAAPHGAQSAPHCPGPPAPPAPGSPAESWPAPSTAVVALTSALALSLCLVTWRPPVACPFQGKGGGSSLTAEKSFWEHQGAHKALAASGVYTVLTFTLLSHDSSLGSFWCPLGRCSLLGKPTEHETTHTQRLALSAFCLVLDFFVISLHLTSPVHPKFVVSAVRRRVMRLHIFSGSIQCAVGPVVYCAALSGFDSVAQAGAAGIACWGILVHTPTALYLLTSAFGAVRIMLPGFLHATGMYAYTLWRLTACAPDRLEQELLSYWLVFHVYVFNRVVFGIATKFNMLAGSRYTVSILLGLAICVPPAQGVAGMLLLMGAILVFNVAFLACMAESDVGHGLRFSAGGSTSAALVKPHLVDPEGCVVAPQLKQLEGESYRSEDLARITFDHLDSDKSGSIDAQEIGHLLVSWGLPVAEAEAVVIENDTNGDGRLEFDEFLVKLRPIWEFGARVALSKATGTSA